MRTVRLHLVATLAAAGWSAAAAQQLDTLTIERAVALALQHQPSLGAASGTIQAYDAIARQARAAFLPSVAFSASDTRTGGTILLTPSLPPALRTYTSYSAALQGALTIWDFGKSSGRQVESDLLADAAVTAFDSAREIVALNTEVAYLAFLESRRVVSVNEEALANSARHLAQTRAFFITGRRPQLDVTKAEVDSLNANVSLIQARNAYRVSKLQLENTMGVHPANEYVAADSSSVPATYTTLEEARSDALRNRPEVIAAQARLGSARAAVTAAWGQHLPTISATGGYTWNGYAFPLLSRWNAGLTFTLPIFQGWALDAGVQLAEANAAIAQSSLDVLTEGVLLEVEQEWLAIREASERAVATAKLVRESEENLNLVERQYAAGVATSLDESDARLTLANSQITDIQAQYDYRTAAIRLRRAMGLTVVPGG
ncbi:MAG TPA: TolC family protein [Bacteroidota bacterium]|nr:TolC family protein [Bacteroidota bacterium]